MATVPARVETPFELKAGASRSGSAPLTPPADHHLHEPEHEMDDLFAAAEVMEHLTHAAMVPSDSSPGSPQNFSDAAAATAAAAAATAAAVAAASLHAKHGRKLDRPRRSPLARTMSSSPGVVFQFVTPAHAEHAETSFQILQYPHSRQPPLAAHVVPAAHAAAPAATADASASASLSETEEDDLELASEDDDSLQEVPYYAAHAADALHAPYGDFSFDEPVRRPRADGHARKAAASGAPRVKSLALPHPTPARSSVFYPKNPKSDRVPGGKQANTGNKKCFACGTKKTPYWRDGWDGVLLCNACGIRFTKYRLRCLKCLYVPRKDEKHFHNCVKCGSQMPPPAR